MNCPRDDQFLMLQGYPDKPRHECRDCQGIYFQEFHFPKSLDVPASTTMKELTGVVDFSAFPPSGLICPRDRQAMRAIVYHGVEVDICPGCRAMWLDHGEYEKILKSEKKPGRGGDIDFPSSSGNSGDGCAPDGDIADGVLDGVFDFLGEAVGSLIDGI